LTGIIARVAEYLTSVGGNHEETIMAFLVALSGEFSAGGSIINDPSEFFAAVDAHFEQVLLRTACDGTGAFDHAKTSAILAFLDFVGKPRVGWEAPSPKRKRRCEVKHITTRRKTLTAFLRAAPITHQQRLIRVLCERRRVLHHMGKTMELFSN
jgi:hypothetical protein